MGNKIILTGTVIIYDHPDINGMSFSPGCFEYSGELMEVDTFPSIIFTSHDGRLDAELYLEMGQLPSGIREVSIMKAHKGVT